REGEFAALEDADARQRIDQGLAALARVGWTPRGFVPPAWLLPRGGIGPLQGFGFEYTTIRRAMIRLDDGWWWRSPAVSLSSRTWLDRSASRFAASRLVRMFDGTRVLRLALHPVDARHPASLRTWGRILPAVLAQREPVTKGDAILALAAATGAERSGCAA
ncbi:MAG TPA: hypothetical protein VLT59_07865, partial [Steroidobacteraceae bacterium]|nr:hypothetical protein [Steroidobacteraceae bacterium]